MGIFGDKKDKAMKNVHETMKKYGAKQQEFINQGGGGSLPDDDPMMQPIEGIALEKYAEICAKMAKNGSMPMDKVVPFVESEGVKPGTWSTVQGGWNGRFAENLQLQTYYGQLYTKFM